MLAIGPSARSAASTIRSAGVRVKSAATVVTAERRLA
jgi:hypothetical protein